MSKDLKRNCGAKEMAPLLHHLPQKHKDLSSIPSNKYGPGEVHLRSQYQEDRDRCLPSIWSADPIEKLHLYKQGGDGKVTLKIEVLRT